MATPSPQRIVVPFEGHTIGEGFNSDSGERVGVALTVGAIGEDAVADGQRAQLRFSMVTSQRSLEETINFSAEVEARYMIFSGNAKLKFVEQSAVNSSSTYILASVFVQNSIRAGSTFTATQNAQRLLDSGDTERFKRAFGDRFCQSLRTGGEFHALVRVTSSDIRYQSQIASSLHAEMNGLAAGGSFKASFDRAKADASAHTEVTISLIQIGGQGAEISLPGADADKIRAQIDRFPASVHANAVAFEAELLTYDTLALNGPLALELEDRRAVLEDCLARKRRYWSAISQLNFLLTDDARLIFIGLPANTELAKLQDSFRQVLGELMTFARGISTGAILPKPFIGSVEPLLPEFARRATTRFREWWARRADPDLSKDEKTLVEIIGRHCGSFLSVSVDAASSAAIEAATGQITEIGFQHNDPDFHLRSFRRLPEMISSPLKNLTANGNVIEDVSGLEKFKGLVTLDLLNNEISDIMPLAALTRLKWLRLSGNNIVDVSPISKLVELETLMIHANNIADLSPLAVLDKLHSLHVGGFHHDTRLATGEILHNPLNDTRFLSLMPRLDNPFLRFETLTVRTTELTLELNRPEQIKALAAGEMLVPRIEAILTRIGNSHEFLFVVDGGEPELMIFGSVEPLATMSGFKIVGLFFPQRRQGGFAVVKIASPATTLTIRETANLLLSDSSILEFKLGINFIFEVLEAA